MTYTNEATLTDSLEILKLEALVVLVRENEQFEIDVRGFTKIVTDFRTNLLAQRNYEIDSLRGLAESLTDELASGDTLRDAERRSLEERSRSVANQLQTEVREQSRLIVERDRLSTSSDSAIVVLQARLDSLGRLTAERQVTLEWQVDSVDVIADGTTGQTRWDFQFAAGSQSRSLTVNINDGDRVRRLQAQPIRFTARAPSSILLLLEGRQADDQEWQVEGEHTVRWPRMDAPQDVAVIIKASVPQNDNEGYFYFYGTLRRVEAP